MNVLLTMWAVLTVIMFFFGNITWNGYEVESPMRIIGAVIGGFIFTLVLSPIVFCIAWIIRNL